MKRTRARRTPRPGRDSTAAPGRSAPGPGAGPRRPLYALLAAAPAVVLAAAALAAANARYITGPPPAHTGGFGEPTCHACHFDAAPDTGTGSLVLNGLDDVYEPGAKRRITVELVSPGMRRAGFELAVRFAEGEAAGTQAGALRALDGRVGITDGDGVQYAHHLETGTDLAAPDTARWVVEWVPPEGGADVVVFHLAANAADDDVSPFGDLIFTDSVRVRAATAAGR